MMRYSANQLPVLISETIRAFVSMRRISEFLDAEELDPNHILKPDASTTNVGKVFSQKIGFFYKRIFHFAHPYYSISKVRSSKLIY